MKGLVSIIMPCYKVGSYIAQALQSVAAQTYPSWEIIAVDDSGPADGTETIIQKFSKAQGQHRVQYVKHAQNMGVSAARNTAIRHAKGEFVALLDPDDYWLPEHLEKGVNCFNNNPRLYFYSSYAHLFNDDNQSPVLGIEGYQQWELKAFPFILSIKNGIPASSTILRTTVFDFVDTFDEEPSIQHVEDYDLWVRILKQGLTMHILPEPTIYYRKHDSAATSNSIKMRTAKLRFEQKHQDWLILYRREALERLSGHIKLQDECISQIKSKNDMLEGRIMILEQSLIKLKSLPFIKQFLYLNARLK